MAGIKTTLTIEKFGKNKEKTGWTYLHIPSQIATKINPGVRKSFRVKGRLDKVSISMHSLLPMGKGSFILVLNGEMRKKLKKKEGEKVLAELEPDERVPSLNQDFLICLREDPDAEKTFNSLSPSHQRYFSDWIGSAKTTPTKSKRIAMALNALCRGMGFPEMLRENKKN